jgi:hypothetical protein
VLRITIELKNKTPLLQRNGRLANPLDPLTQEVAQLAKKKNKTPEDYRQLLPLEAYGGCYETPEGFLGVPTANVHACMVKAAAGFRQGTLLDSALLFETDAIEPLLIEGLPADAHDYCYNEALDHLFIRTVVISGRRTLRARAIVRKAWTTVHTFTLLDDIINPNDLKKIFDRAGRLIGICDWRPHYGTFSTRVVDTQVIEEEAAA